MDFEANETNSLSSEKRQLLPGYISSSEEEADVAPSVPKRRKKIDKKWRKEKVFQSKESAQKAVESEGTWSFYHKNVDKDGSVSNIYRCNKVIYRGEQCQAGVYLGFPSHSTEIILYRSQLAHTCDKISTKSKNKISEEVKNEIRRLFEDDTKIKPKALMEILNKKKLEVPKIVDLKNLLASLRKQKFGPHTISLGELEKFFIDNSVVPEDENKGFVVSFESEYEEPSYFRVFVTSKYLLKLAINVKHIHADATYKLVWQGFPVLIVGTTDVARQFHPFGVGISSNEQTDDFIFLFQSLKLGTEKVYGEEIHPTTIVCDASSAISNAFKHVFGEETVTVMCWAHMKKNVQRKAEQLVRPKSDIKKIMSDIDSLQLSQNKAVFDHASQLFIQKWQEQNEFMTYFKKEWLDSNRNWFEGISKTIPSTNNALEAFNRVIKDENTLRERFSVGQFSIMLMQYIETWSNNYISQLKTVYMQPNIDLQLWTKAYQWAKENNQIIVENNSDNSIYFIPSQDKHEFAENDLTKNKEMDFESFDEYKEVMFNIWTTTIPNNKENWIDGDCNCPEYFKKRICKHIVGIAIRMKATIPPPEAKALPLGMKRRRGRPAKSKKALLMQ